MKAILILTLFCLAGPNPRSAMAQASADGAPRVGRWGELARLEFHGVKTFATNDVVNALLQSPEYLLGAHPAAPRQEFTPALSKALVAGYHNAGFRDAQATVSLDEARQRVLVEVVEGPRFRCGTVRVLNARKLPVTEVVRRLTQMTQPKEEVAPNDMFKAHKAVFGAKKDAVWTTGETVAFDEQATTNRHSEVDQVLASCGFYFAKFKLRLEPQRAGDLMDLVIDLQSEGPVSKLGKIDVTGLSRHTPAELLSWLDVKPGQPLTFDLVPRLERRMEESGRFLTQRVTPDLAEGNAGHVGLHIEVKEFTNSPALGKPFSANEQHMLRMRAWTESAFLSGEEFLLDLRVTNAPFMETGLRISTRVQLTIRRDAIVLLQWSGEKLERGFAATTNGLVYVSVATGRRFESPLWKDLRVTASAGIETVPEPEGTNSPFNMSLGMGFENLLKSNQSPIKLSMKISPGAMIHKARLLGKETRTEGGVLNFGPPEDRWRIKTATGALVEITTRSSSETNGTIETSYRPVPGAVARAERDLRAAGAAFPNLLITSQPVASILGALVAETMESPLMVLALPKDADTTRLKPAASGIQRLLLSGVLAYFERPLDEPTPVEENFNVPGDPPPANLPGVVRVFWGQLSAWLHRFSQEYLPAGSWPATLTREGVMLFNGHPQYAEPELTRILESPQTGPLGCLVSAQLLAQAGIQSGSAAFAKRGLERLGVEHFRHDADLLLTIVDNYLRGDGKPKAAFTTLTPDELAALGSLLPASARGFLIRSATALRLQPERGMRAVLEPLLMDWWQAGLNKEVEGQLRRLLTTASARTAAQQIFEQGMAHLQGADATQAARLFKEAAEQGNAAAAYQLGILYEKGLGVERNFMDALTWFVRAATSGVIEAQMKLGDVYSNGFDAPTDYMTATFWYRLAELGGNPVASSLGKVTARKLTPEQHAEVARRLKALLPKGPAGGAGASPPNKR